MQMSLEWYPSLERYTSASRADSDTERTDVQGFLIEDLFPDEGPSRAGGRPQPVRSRKSFTTCESVPLEYASANPPTPAFDLRVVQVRAVRLH